HQAIEDLSIMGGIPGMKLFCPADDEELASALPALMADPSPCYIRYTAARPITAHPRPNEPEKVELLAEGDDVTILTHGLGVAQALEARTRLAADGSAARVVNVRMPRPLDAETVLAAIRGARVTLVVEDHLRAGGLYAIIAALLVERGVRAKVVPLDLGERWFTPAMLPDVIAKSPL